jgi:hypothetical protein
MRTLGASVLTMEALVISFALLVAKDLSVRSEIPVGVLGGVLALLCLLAAGLLKRQIGWVLGSLIQVGLIALGFVVPMMFLLGALFAGLWAAAIIVGRMGERARARWQEIDSNPS